MKITYDPAVDALYVQVTSEEIERTVEVRPDVYVDLDAQDEVVGYEMLNFRVSNTDHFLELNLPTQQEVLAAVG